MLVPALALVSLTNLINTERTASLTRSYGAATTGVLVSLEIFFAWGMAVLLYAAAQRIAWLDGLGTPAHSSSGPPCRKNTM